VQPTQRYFLEITYDGTRYHGWQLQPNAVTVQRKLNEALAILLRQPVETTGAGRTDTGVHARQLFVHFDWEDSKFKIQNSKLVLSLNALLPADISVKRIIEVAADAHARFDATQRSYEYHIHFGKDPFKTHYSWLLRDRPDVELMNQAAAMMMAYTDFSCFSKSNTQVMTNNCKITQAEWVTQPDGSLIFHISADRFLRNMVRAIVGTLLMVGRREIAPERVQQIIESKNRSNAGTSVPACGLYLTKVRYPYISP
jgi:tRNA pseudouridine38-40 synthase